MSAGHTPGRWSVGKYPGRVVVQDRVGFNGPYRVADAYYSDSLANCPRADEGDANARLIAAAPDLLAALEALLADCGKTRSDGYVENSIHSDEVTKARAAIARALGTTPNNGEA